MSTTTEPSRVFISYSHRDREYLERLQVHLKPLERLGLVERWDDTRIGVGDQWHEEIVRALASARVAVLLVSADFLASDFIAKAELPPLLAAEQGRGLVVMPVIVGPSRFAQTPDLARFQAANDPSRPLSAMPRAKQEAVWVKLVNAIEGVLASRPAGPRPADPSGDGWIPASISMGPTRPGESRPLGPVEAGPTPATVGKVARGSHRVAGLRARRDSLVARHEAANRQWIATLNEADRVPLQAQLDDLERQIGAIEDELGRLPGG